MYMTTMLHIICITMLKSYSHYHVLAVPKHQKVQCIVFAEPEFEVQYNFIVFTCDGYHVFYMVLYNPIPEDMCMVIRH